MYSVRSGTSSCRLFSCRAHMVSQLPLLVVQCPLRSPQVPSLACLLAVDAAHLHVDRCQDSNASQAAGSARSASHPATEDIQSVLHRGHPTVIHDVALLLLTMCKCTSGPTSLRSPAPAGPACAVGAAHAPAAPLQQLLCPQLLYSFHLQQQVSSAVCCNIDHLKEQQKSNIHDASWQDA